MNAVNGGTRMYSRLLYELRDQELYWFATGNNSDTLPNSIVDICKLVYNSKSILFNKFWLKFMRLPPFSLIHLFFLYFFYIPIVYFRVSRAIKNNKPNVVWIEMVRHNYFLAFLLKKNNKVKLHYSFNDPYSANVIYGERWFLKFLFINISKNIETCDCISESMLTYFQNMYVFKPKKSMVLWLHSPILKPKNLYIHNFIKANNNRILFYGSIHGLSTFRSFARAVEYLNSINNTKMKIDIFSSMDYSFLEREFESVDYKGFIEEEKLDDIISKYYFLYVPMYFEKNFAEISLCSLSSKIILGVQNGLPIFTHGPAFSANSKFVEDYNLGLNCNDLSLEGVTKSINKLIELDLISYSNSFYKNITNILNYDAQVKGFRDLLFFK